MINGLLSEIQSHGHRGAIIPFFRIRDLKTDMLELQHGEYHTEWLDRMINHIAGDADKYLPPDMKFEPRSMMTIVMPNPKVMLEFHYRGKSIPCAIPPHYSNWDFNNKQALQYLENFLAPHGHSVAMAVTLPHKLLAVHAGLAVYGRNNICYSGEFGSHMQIMTYISDLPCTEDVWLPLSRMRTCEKCHACATSCPTGAIDKNRRLIDADKCITNVNEVPERFPDGFPEWISDTAHNSIVGCSLCQDCCPGNAHNQMNTMAGATFTEQETMEILSYNGNAAFADSISGKLGATGLLQEYTSPMAVSRNLAALLRKECS